MTGIRDPKPGSNSWAIGEKLTQDQLTKMLENQRVFMTSLFLDMRRRPQIDLTLSASDDPVQDVVGSGYVWYASASVTANSLYKSDALEWRWVSANPSLTPAASVNPTRGAAKSGTSAMHMWFGLNRKAATSEGYIKATSASWTTNNTFITWSIVNRAAAGTALDTVVGMWYWEEKDTFIASWSYASNTHRLETNTADAGWVDAATGLTGDFEIRNADASPTDFVGVGVSPSGSVTTEICHSTNGTSFSALTVPSKRWSTVAYDRTDGIWYLLAADGTLYTSVDPADGFSQETGFSLPTISASFGRASSIFGDASSAPPKMIVQGGVICIGSTHGAGLIVTRDMGATWYRTTPFDSQSDSVPIMKIIGGQLFAMMGWSHGDADGDVPYVGPRGLEPGANY